MTAYHLIWPILRSGISRDDKFIGEMLAEISIFLSELENTITEITMKRAA
jgi:hypothetical protein